MRPGEALRLKWIDIDNEKNIIILNDPEKNSRARIWKVSNLLIEKLNGLPKEIEHVFSNRPRQTVQKNFDGQRKRIAARLGNPRLQRITFRTFRHWKATMEYHRTRDILHTMEFLGHKNIKNTLIYTQLVKFKESDDFHSTTAKTAEEAKKLVEAGFDYICTTPEEIMIFRKRK
jgi:integrase